jgi:hypothetical protein
MYKISVPIFVQFLTSLSTGLRQGARPFARAKKNEGAARRRQPILVVEYCAAEFLFPLHHRLGRLAALRRRTRQRDFTGTVPL